MRAFALLGAAWAYRGFIMGSVRREFQAKYGNAMLGAAWTLLQPLAMIVVYTVIFAQVMHSKLPGNASTFAYSIYLCAGILTWGLFAEILARAQTMFLDNASLIKKISFPRICLPIIVVLSALLNFAIIFGLFVVFLVLSGTFPGLVFFTILPVLLVQVLFAVGLGLLVGLLNVFFRDVGQLFSIVLQFWFWFTPVVYPTSILPEGIRALLVYNPMAAVIGAYQTVLVDARAPDWPSLLPVTVAALLLCVLGLRMFRRRAGEMVDEL
ncbi:ABC transporter permease [Pseudoduganella buxea]|uniref:Transport permease protein n=1 Tax=Pseudoduganella buxea TaxID=1949069 RepID=A0A6I3T121_9BURK|nr:ABC transporter permease [Pseudoduganella buxea]MTV53387.1 ABC transporter permease [Pseudoduganella buxea]GGC07106.1 transport permease protein [Pseudoduganella buxea]